MDYQLLNVVLTVGEVYRITGVVDFSFGEYRLNPRDADDITNTTGISDQEVTSLAIYPNPATDILNIVSGNDIQSLSIVNIHGSLVMKSNVSNSNTQTISVSDLPAGVYFLKVQTANETQTSRFVIK